MTIGEILTVASTVTLSFGGGAVIVIGLSGWLGNIWAKRILQNESAALQRKLEELRHEMALTKSSYEHYLDLILNYYSTFYRHYRLCQRTASADAHRTPDGEITHTKDEFLAQIDQFLREWADQEGRIRLLLPAKIMSVHEDAIKCFNDFKRAIDAFKHDEESHEKKKVTFRAVDEVKSRMEVLLREFLRTEQLLK